MSTHLAVTSQRPLTLLAPHVDLCQIAWRGQITLCGVLSMRLIYDSSSAFVCFFKKGISFPLLWDLIPHKSWKGKDVTLLPSLVADIHRPSERFQQPLAEHISG